MSKTILGFLGLLLIIFGVTIAFVTKTPPRHPSEKEHPFSGFPYIAKQPQKVQNEIIDMVKFLSMQGFSRDAAVNYLAILEDSYKSDAKKKDGRQPANK